MMTIAAVNVLPAPLHERTATVVGGDGFEEFASACGPRSDAENVGGEIDGVFADGPLVWDDIFGWRHWLSSCE